MASSQHEVDTNRELESLDGAATWLVASFTTLTAGLTAFGAVSGGLTRMLRNYPGLSLSAAILTSAAIGLGIAAKTFTRPIRMTLRTFLVLIGVLLFVIVLAVVVSGGLTWMLRNYPGLSVWGAILASVAIGIGLGMTLSRPIRITGGTVDSITARRWLLRIGVLFFVIGLTLAVTAATQAPHGRERPQITASLNYENGLTLVGEVKASDLRWTDFMEVSVLAAWISEDSPNSIRWESRKFLYISHTGPDADGNVNLALRVPIRTEKRWNIIQVAGSIERERAPFPNCTPEAPKNSAV